MLASVINKHFSRSKSINIKSAETGIYRHLQAEAGILEKYLRPWQTSMM